MKRKVLQFSRKDVRDMSTVIEARSHLEAIIGPIPPGAPLKSVFPRVARMLGVTVRRVETIWHRQARRIDAGEMDRLRVLSPAKKPASAEVANANRYDAIAQALEATDPDFHGQDIARFRSMARALRGADHHREMAR